MSDFVWAQVTGLFAVAVAVIGMYLVGSELLSYRIALFDAIATHPTVALFWLFTLCFIACFMRGIRS